jgi:hypothetical protein
MTVENDLLFLLKGGGVIIIVEYKILVVLE